MPREFRTERDDINQANEFRQSSRANTKAVQAMSSPPLSLSLYLPLSHSLTQSSRHLSPLGCHSSLPLWQLRHVAKINFNFKFKFKFKFEFESDFVRVRVQLVFQLTLHCARASDPRVLITNDLLWLYILIYTL